MDSRHPPGAAELLQHSDFLRRLARGLVRDAHEAEDVVQHAFAAALEHPRARPGPLRAWLATLARNHAFNLGRERANRERRERLLVRDEAQESHEHAAERIELQRVVCELVLALEPGKRTALYLRYYEDLAPAEIARRLGVPEKTLKSRLHRTLGELRARLDQRHGGERGAWLVALLPLASPRGATAVLLGKKTWAVAAAVLVLGLGTWRAWPRGSLPGSEAAAATTTVLADPELPEATAPQPATSDAVDSARTPLADAPRTGTLLVRLRWADGTAAAGVGFSAWSRNDGAPRVERARHESDARGEVRVVELAPGPVELRLDRAVDLEATAVAGETRTVEWTLPAGEDVQGVVRSAEGTPVAGAEVWVECWEERMLGWPIARSAGDGSFAIRALGLRGQLVARARGHLPSRELDIRTAPLTAGGARAVELMLGPAGGGVEGCVVDPDGKPVAGAVVRGRFRESASALTDTDGMFSLPSDLRAESVIQLRVDAHGFPSFQGEYEVPDADILWIDVALERPARVRGHVRTESGEPVAGAEVLGGVGLGWPVYDEPHSAARTAADGSFLLDWVEPRQIDVHGTAPDTRLGRAQARIVCRAGEETSCELRLDPGLTIRGRVVDGEQRPIAGWKVADSPPEDQDPAEAATTDDDGLFVLTNVVEGKHELVVNAPGEQPIPARARVTASPGDEVEIVVSDTAPRRSAIAGVVRRRDGSVPVEVRLILTPEDPRGGYALSLDPRTGAFRQGDLQAGAYTLSATVDNVLVAEPLPLTLAKDAELDIGTVWIEPPGSVEIEITGEIPGGMERISASLQRPDWFPVRLERHGLTFTSTKVPPGRYTVHAPVSDAFTHTVEIEVTSGALTRAACRVEPAFPLTVTVALGSRDTNEESFTLTVEGPDGETLHERTYGIDSQPLQVRSGGNLVTIRSALGAPDAGTRTLQLRLPRGTAILRLRTDHGRTATATTLVAGDPADAVELRIGD